MTEAAAKTETNWLAYSTIALLVLAIVLGALAFQSLNKKVESNERIVVEGLEREFLPNHDPDHVPCKKCRAALNDGLQYAVARERAEILVALKLAKTGHGGHDSGLTHAAKLIENRE